MRVHEHIICGQCQTLVPRVRQVAAQAFTFLLAGYETTASALAFTVYHVGECLARDHRPAFSQLNRARPSITPGEPASVDKSSFACSFL